MVNASKLVEAIRIYDALMNRADKILDKHGIKYENVCYVSASKDCKKIDIGYEYRYMPPCGILNGITVKHRTFPIEKALALLDDIE